MNQEKFKCCMCGKGCEGFGNNPAPLKTEGRCCDECNTKVAMARFAASKERGGEA